MRIHHLLLLFLALAAAKRKSKTEDAGTERLMAEVQADGDAAKMSQSAEMAEHEAKAIASLDAEYKNALKDIMAVLLHGSDDSKTQAMERLVGLAISSGEAGREQARTFRSAVVAGGALPALVETLSGGLNDAGEFDEETGADAENPRRRYLAAAALHALALDDPETDDDNFHQGEICDAGAVGPLARLLDAEDVQVQAAATGALSALAENPTCQEMIVASGAIQPLLTMAHYGSDHQKLLAMGALEVLAVNNENVRQQLNVLGGDKVLDGIATMGSTLLREEAKAFGQRLKEKPAAKMDAEAQIKAARQTRMRYDGVRQRAFSRMQGWGETQQQAQQAAATGASYNLREG